MKKMIAMAMMFVVLTASFASAAEAPVQNVDVKVGNDTKIDVGGGNSTVDQKQKMQQDQDQNQDAHSSAIIRGNLPEVGFVGFLTPGTPIPGTEWKFFYSKIYSRLSMKKIEKMRYGFHFSDLWFTKWGGRVQYTPMGESLPKNEDDILMMNYWPETDINQGDEILGGVVVVGESDWSDAAFLGEAEKACKENTMTRRIAVSYAEYVDGVTLGGSVGASGSTAQVAENSGTVFAAGGMLGKTKTRAERIRRVKALCMNDGPLYLMDVRPPAPKPEPPPVVIQAPAPQPPAACNPDEIWKRITELKQEVQKCTRYCYNNLVLRSALGDAYIELYVCTGDKKYLTDATYNYQVAERNFRNGHDISAHKAEASQVIAQVYYNWAGCKNITEGNKSAMTFAKAKKLERIPLGFSR